MALDSVTCANAAYAATLTNDFCGRARLRCYGNQPKEAGMSKMLMGAFENPEQADQALRELEEKGYTPEQISAISSSNKYEDKGYDKGENMAKGAGSGAV